MYEIELKAHIYNHAALQAKLHSFASFIGTCEKSDVYWQQAIPLKDAHPVRLRIREQKTEYPNGKTLTEVLVTYKQKELRYAQGDNSQNPTSYEVNNEQEFTISDRFAFEVILRATGFTITLEKHKNAMQWKHDDVFLELCTIRGLGDFLELEIMARNNDQHTAESARIKLENLLTRCDIPLEQIESKYYSILLENLINK